MKYRYELIDKNNFIYDDLYIFLNKVDNDLPIPISSKIKIDTFLSKIFNLGKVYCAFDNDKLIGTCFFYCNDENQDLAFLTLLVIDAKYRHKGIGNRLVDLMIKHCKMLSFKRLRLYTRFNNVQAIQFYKKIGFQEVKSDRIGDIMFELKLG